MTTSTPQRDVLKQFQGNVLVAESWSPWPRDFGEFATEKGFKPTHRLVLRALKLRSYFGQPVQVSRRQIQIETGLGNTAIDKALKELTLREGEYPGQHGETPPRVVRVLDKANGKAPLYDLSPLWALMETWLEERAARKAQDEQAKERERQLTKERVREYGSSHPAYANYHGEPAEYATKEEMLRATSERTADELEDMPF